MGVSGGKWHEDGMVVDDYGISLWYLFMVAMIENDTCQWLMDVDLAMNKSGWWFGT